MAKPPPTTLRLLLLPISTRRSLIYCEPASQHLPAAQQTYFDKAVNKASKTWTEWEKDKSVWDWKKKVTRQGNNLLRRIPFEEWGLKSIPGLRKERRLAYEQDPTKMRVEVRYPGLYQGLQKESVLEMCRRLSTERQPLHKKKLWQSVAIMPLTIPVGLIPIMPNLPFLYLAFRAYSHYTALFGSRHLEFLVNNNLLVAKPSSTLDSLYTAGLWHPTRNETREGKVPTEDQSKSVVSLVERQMEGRGKIIYSAEAKKFQVPAAPRKRQGESTDGAGEAQEEGEEIMLLKGWNGKLLAEKLALPELEVEIERAVEQVERDLQKARKVEEEKTAADKAEKSPSEK